MSRFSVLPLTTDGIRKQAIPTDPGQPEAIPHVLFDTQTITAAASGNPLTFFQSSGIADETLTNVLSGRLPEGYSFRVQAMGLDILREPSANPAQTTVGVLTDIARIVKTNRAVFEFSKSSKGYSKVPATFLHSSGGETGFIAASFTAPNAMQYGNNGVFSGGFDTDGAIWILPNEGFKGVLSFANGATALGADTPVRIWLRGTLYRPVR